MIHIGFREQRAIGIQALASHAHHPLAAIELAAFEVIKLQLPSASSAASGIVDIAIFDHGRRVEAGSRTGCGRIFGDFPAANSGLVFAVVPVAGVEVAVVAVDQQIGIFAVEPLHDSIGARFGDFPGLTALLLTN